MKGENIMSYTLTLNSKVSKARKPLQDGEYTCKITRLEQPAGKNPYIVFTTDSGELRFYINNDKALEIITSNLNEQLGIDVAEDIDVFSWFNAIVGKEVTMWRLSSEGTDDEGNPVVYHNVTPYKPAQFDAVMNGAL
jgi:hypothetical protein